MLPFFLSIERGDSSYFLCILSFPFPFFSEIRSQNKSQNLPSVFYIFIFLTFFLFGHSSNHLPSVHYCTERTRKRTQSYMCMHTHVHAFFPSCIHIIHSFIYTIFLTLFRALSLFLSVALALSYSLLILLSLSLLHLSFSLEEKRAMSDKPSHMNAYTTHISILNQYGNSKFGEFLGALLRQ